MNHTHKQRSTWIITGLGAVGLLAAFTLFLINNPMGRDYFDTFYPAARGWLNGSIRLYDGQIETYHHPPWTVFALLPLAWLPYAPSLALLWLLMLACISFGVIQFSRPGQVRSLALLLALASFPTLNMLTSGQIVGLEVLGIAVGWAALRRGSAWGMGAAYLLLMMVPPNSVPAAALLFSLSLARWPLRRAALSVVMPLLLLAASFIIFPGWPGRWYALYSTVGAAGEGFWLTTIWRGAQRLGAPAWLPWVAAGLVLSSAVWGWMRLRQAADLTTHQHDLACLMLGISAWYLVSPYLTTYRLVVIMAVVLPFLASWRWPSAVVLYIFSLTPLLRFAWFEPSVWLDVLLAAAAYVLILGYILRQSLKQRSAPHDRPPEYQRPGTNLP